MAFWIILDWLIIANWSFKYSKCRAIISSSDKFGTKNWYFPMINLYLFFMAFSVLLGKTFRNCLHFFDFVWQWYSSNVWSSSRVQLPFLIPDFKKFYHLCWHCFPLRYFRYFGLFIKYKFRDIYFQFLFLIVSQDIISLECSSCCSTIDFNNCS